MRMRIRQKRFLATDSETVVSNPNNEEDIEKVSPAGGEIGMNEISNTVSSSSFSYVEENILCQEEVIGNDGDKVNIIQSADDPELIESRSSVEEAHHRDNDEQFANHKESRKGRYMPLLKGSGVFLSFYQKLLKRNGNRESATEVDYAQDYYSTHQYSKDWLGKDDHDITDVDSSSNGEYHEIDPEKDQKKVDKGGLDYVPMLSFTHMLSHEVANKDEESQEEYLDILAPNDIIQENNSLGSGKRDSDYLVPVETDLPAFPKTSDEVSSCSYAEELPLPPMDLLTSTNADQNSKRNGSPLNILGLSNQGCRCEKDLMCKNCLDIHSVAKHTKLDQEQISSVKLGGAKEEESDEDFEYMPMDLSRIAEKGAGVKEKVQRNSADYAIPLKKPTKAKRDQGGFPEELNKKNLSSSCDKRLMPNKKEANDFTVRGYGKDEAREEKGYQGLPSPRNARKAIGNGKLPKEKNGHIEKNKPKLCPQSSFSKSKALFENNSTASPNQTKKMEGFSKRKFKSEEQQSAFDTPNPTSNDAGKARSGSCPVEGTNNVKPNTSFLADLENVLKASGIDEISGQKAEDIEMEMEHNYELDYEDVSSPTESKYENDDFYSGSRPGSRTSSGEYDYVHEKERKSLHFYEAVTKHSVEFEEDQYERI